MLALYGLLSVGAYAQDSLKTTVLSEVVVTGTKFDLPAEKSGKTIFKLNQKDLERNAGKTLADLLQEVPGVQTDGNFGTPSQRCPGTRSRPPASAPGRWSRSRSGRPCWPSPAGHAPPATAPCTG